MDLKIFSAQLHPATKHNISSVVVRLIDLAFLLSFPYSHLLSTNVNSISLYREVTCFAYQHLNSTSNLQCLGLLELT